MQQRGSKIKKERGVQGTDTETLRQMAAQSWRDRESGKSLQYHKIKGHHNNEESDIK